LSFSQNRTGQNPKSAIHNPQSGADLRPLVDAGLAALGLEADADQRERLLAFIALLARWNRAYNLTAVRDPTEMIPRHLLDSLTVSPYLQGEAILDAGTGAGLPGIPLAILAPTRRFVLLDSNGKKIRFVRQTVGELRLANVTAVQARLESYRSEEKFATIVSRAVTSVSALAAAAAHLLDRPARLLAMKGRYPADELDFEPPGPLRVHRLTVPFLDGERHLIEIRYD
jgi:16S rRNA (guanine527-N7)-methyltransferase